MTKKDKNNDKKMLIFFVVQFLCVILSFQIKMQ